MTLSVKRRDHTPARRIRNALVVSKITAVMAAHKSNDRHFIDLVNSGDPTVKEARPAHDQHLESLLQVMEELNRRHIAFIHSRVDDLPMTRISSDYDLVIAVGGDGTIIDVTHRPSSVPIIGVNSAPSTSHGHFCLATPDTLGSLLDSIESEALSPLHIMRIRACIDGKVIGRPVLNEIFVNNAATIPWSAPRARYILKVDGREEKQNSDGVFFGTAAGSTAWMRDYYANIMDIEERRIQFLVRGAFIDPDKPLHLIKGFVENPETLQLVSMMDEGFVAVDGTRNSFPFPRGSVLTIRPSRQDIRLYADPHCNDRYRKIPLSA
jgi:NAD kinase